MAGFDNSAAGGYAIWCGVDVGKSEHHACALDARGRRVHDRPLPNDEAALVKVLTGLQAHGRVLVVVDQPAAIGALVIAVARSLGIDVGYLPGLAMRRIADLLELLAAAPTLTALRAPGAEAMTEVLRAGGPPKPTKTLPGKILTALDAQTAVMPGTPDFGRMVTGSTFHLIPDLR